MQNTPIIFCHYGFSKYLEYVFECVRISNPNKTIILLGDASNKEVATKYGLSHFNLSDYDFGEDIKTFDRVYQLVTTKSFDSYKHGEDWNKFVFRKWIILNNFLLKHKIERFWHFDSDNMIFSDLTRFEEKYKDLDASEQCFGHCIKGIFNNQKIIERYVKKTNEIFMRNNFIEDCKIKMANTDEPACFSEMSTYIIMKSEEKISTLRFSEVRDGGFFDDLMCRSQGMKMEKLPLGEDTKVVFMNPDGRFFCQEENGNFAEAHALNLSWMPIYIYNAMLKHFKKNHKKPKCAPNINAKTLAQVSVPLKQKLKQFRKKFRKKKL